MRNFQEDGDQDKLMAEPLVRRKPFNAFQTKSQSSAHLESRPKTFNHGDIPTPSLSSTHRLD